MALESKASLKHIAPCGKPKVYNQKLKPKKSKLGNKKCNIINVYLHIYILILKSFTAVLF